MTAEVTWQNGTPISAFYNGHPVSGDILVQNNEHVPGQLWERAVVELTEADDWEYGFYDSHPAGNWRDAPEPQENPTIWWYTFGGLVGFDSVEMAQHTASKSVWGQAVIVRHHKGATDWELVPDERIEE